MADEFNLHSIYEQNLSFLFGAGASNGFLPTLALQIKDDQGKKCTFETLAKRFEHNDNMRTLLFMLYYRECINLGLPTGDNVTPRPPNQFMVIKEYKRFLSTLVEVLEKQGTSAKKANIYTTNYDSCFEIASDELLREQSTQFAVNDGSAGFQTRTFHTKNFNQRVVHKGIFDRHDQYLPQLNLLHAHGSVYWEKGRDNGEIKLNYGCSNYRIAFGPVETELLDAFNVLLNDEKKITEDLVAFEQEHNFAPLQINDFWSQYEEIPIVNPTKRKFHETVFEEAYYQILRHLSYELERPNSVLITFGFSFADEHILNLIQRSLSNPSLTVYISCFNDGELAWMTEAFKGYKNVKFIHSDENLDLDFTHFNDKKFTLAKGKGSKNVDNGVNQ
jgi:hypothetical protein